MMRLALLLLALAAVAAGCDTVPRVKVHAEGGASDVDWRIGLPF